MFLAKQLCYLNCILCNRFLEKRTFVFFPWYSYTQIDQELKHAIAKKVFYPLTSLFCKSYLRFQQGKFCKKSFKKHLNIFFFNACVRSQEYDEGSLQQIKKILKCYFNTRPFCAFLCVYRLCSSHELIHVEGHS